MENQLNRDFEELKVFRQVLEESRLKDIALNATRLSMLFVKETDENSPRVTQVVTPQSTPERMLTSSSDGSMRYSDSSTSGEVNQRRREEVGEEVNQLGRETLIVVPNDDNVAHEEDPASLLEQLTNVHKELLKKLIMETHRASIGCGITLYKLRTETVDQVTKCCQKLLSQAISLGTSLDHDDIVATLNETVANACSKVNEVPATDVDACELAISNIHVSKLALILEGMEAENGTKNSVKRAFKTLVLDIGLLFHEVVQWMKLYSFPVDNLEQAVVSCERLAVQLVSLGKFSSTGVEDAKNVQGTVGSLRNELGMYGVMVVDTVLEEAWQGSCK